MHLRDPGVTPCLTALVTSEQLLHTQAPHHSWGPQPVRPPPQCMVLLGREGQGGQDRDAMAREEGSGRLALSPTMKIYF